MGSQEAGTTGPAPSSMLPLRTGPAGCLSVRMRHAEDADSRDSGRRLLVEAGAPDLPGFSGIYRATEALPVRYDRDWPDGAPTPGVCLLTFFHRRPCLDYTKFIRRWHVGHTGLSLRLHPLWHYNRNVVDQVVAPDTARIPGQASLDGSDVPPFDGIVEEHFRRRDDLLNPFRFYGRFPAILWNMLTILVDILGFIDLRRIETYLTREMIVKSSAEGGARSVATNALPSRDRVRGDPFPSES